MYTHPILNGIDRALAAFARGLIRGYRLVGSPLLATVLGPGNGCRHQPTCSVYALECFQRYSTPRAAWLALRRIGRCHPWGTAGYDPVPAAAGESPEGGPTS